MSELKESNSAWYKPQDGWALWIAECVVGVLVLSIWSPVAALLGIAQPWITLIFIAGWVIFWMSPQGPKARAVLQRIIRREG